MYKDGGYILQTECIHKDKGYSPNSPTPVLKMEIPPAYDIRIQMKSWCSIKAFFFRRI